ncbi:MAG: hypothetical protein V4547_15165 [Bacteroidota bacterium]
MKEPIIKIANNILLIALLCFFVWQLYASFIKYEDKFENPVIVTKQDYGNDFITQYGNRFVEIKKLFPKPTNLTYIGENNEDFASGALHYILTQYYLSPNLILRNQIVRDTIIYNLYNSKQITPSTNFHLKNGWHIVKDFNNGLIVLAK